MPARSAPGDSDTLRFVLLPALIHFDTATGQTLALLVTFVGIGIFVNVLIVYIVFQVMAERRQNRERQQRYG
jgi:hypothetical protein